MTLLWILGAAVMAAVVAFAALAWRVDSFSRACARPTPAKAIVVLGALVRPPNGASPALARRAEKAAELYRQGLAPLMIFSGGVVGKFSSEASVARDLAVRAGVPPAACVLEEASHTTRENAEQTAALLRSRRIDEVVLVSDGYHLFRAGRLFAAQGIRTQPVASRRALTTGDRVYWTMREALALLRTPAILLR